MIGMPSAATGMRTVFFMVMNLPPLRQRGELPLVYYVRRQASPIPWQNLPRFRGGKEAGGAPGPACGEGAGDREARAADGRSSSRCPSPGP